MATEVSDWLLPYLLFMNNLLPWTETEVSDCLDLTEIRTAHVLRMEVVLGAIFP